MSFRTLHYQLNIVHYVSDVSRISTYYAGFIHFLVSKLFIKQKLIRNTFLTCGKFNEN